MRPLLDADILLYEVGVIGDKEDGPTSFDYVAEILDGKILEICEAAQATEPPVLYLTGKNNFREEIAVTKVYKGNRKDAKPYHYQNLRVYMHNQYEVRVQDGLEADDLLSIDQTYAPPNSTIICTRDKDLRMIPGWHYGWECGGQREYGPVLVDHWGRIELDRSRKAPKLVGTGMMFFYAQLLMGDPVDNIPGVPLVGPKKAYEILTREDDRSLYEKVRDVYTSKNLTDEYFMEQANLLWMVRELNEDGSPVLWKPPT